MNAKNLAILTLVAVAAIALALWMTGGDEGAGVSDQTKLLPEFLGRVNEVTEIRLRPADGEDITVRKADAGWQVVEAGGYPADLSAVREALLALANAEILDPKTSKPELYGKLGVEDPEAEGAESLLLEVIAPEFSHALIVGRYEARLRPGTFVRRPEEVHSYLVSGDLAFDREPVNWLMRDILNVTAAEVESIRIAGPDGAELVLTKHGEERTNFEVQGIPEGRELSSPAAGNPIAGALSSLRMEDVYPAREIDWDNLDPLTATFTLFDGRRYEVRAARRDAEAIIHIEGDFDQEQAERFARAKQAAGELNTDVETNAATDNGATDSGDEAEAGETVSQDADPALPDFEQVAQDAAAVNQRLANWAFVIPGYKYDALNKTMDDLLKPLPEPSDTVDAGEGNGAGQ